MKIARFSHTRPNEQSPVIDYGIVDDDALVVLAGEQRVAGEDVMIVAYMLLYIVGGFL